MVTYRLYYRGESDTNVDKIEAIKALRRAYGFSLREGADIVSAANRDGYADFNMHSDFIIVAPDLPLLYELEVVTNTTNKESANSSLSNMVTIEEIRVLMYRALDNRQYELLEALMKARQTIC